jgi:hypothetical protein
VGDAFKKNGRIDAQEEKTVDVYQVGINIVRIYQRYEMVMFEIYEPSRDYDVYIPEIGKPLLLYYAIQVTDRKYEQGQKSIEKKNPRDIDQTGVYQHDRVHDDYYPERQNLFEMKTLVVFRFNVRDHRIYSGKPCRIFGFLEERCRQEVTFAKSR